MPRSIFIANRLREVLLSGRWIANTNYREQLSMVTHEEATRKINGLNSIAALTYHVNYYLSGLIRVLDGGPLDIRDQYSFDLPHLKSGADWENMVRTFFSNAEEFIAKTERLPDATWDEPFVDKKYGTYWRNWEGVIEHCYYHLGQVSLLRKLITQEIK